MKRFSIKDLPNKYSNGEYNLKQMTTNDLKHWKEQGCLDDEETGILYIVKSNEIDYIYIGNKCTDSVDDITTSNIKLAIYFDGDDLMVKAKNDVDIEYISNAIDEILSIYDETNNTMFCGCFETETVQEVEKTVQVEVIPTSELLDYVMQNFDLAECQIRDINRFYLDFIDKTIFDNIIDFLNDIYGFVAYAINLINSNGRYGTLDMYCRSDIVEIIFNYSNATKELFEEGDNGIFILMSACLRSNSRYISKWDNTLYIENAELVENELRNLSANKRNSILDLIEHCEHFTTKRELLTIVSNQFKISKDVVIELYNHYMDNLYLDVNENIELTEKTPNSFKVGCFYTGSDKSLYFVTRRGLNTIDVMSISKGFQQYDITIVTDIYNNEYVNILYDNLIVNISSINLKYTEKDIKRILYDFVNNNFYGNNVYGKYAKEDVERVLNSLYDKIID